MKEIGRHRLGIVAAAQVERTTAEVLRATGLMGARSHGRPPALSVPARGMTFNRRNFLWTCAGISAVTLIPIKFAGCDLNNDGKVDFKDLEIAVALLTVAFPEFAIGQAIYGAMQLINNSGAPWKGIGEFGLLNDARDEVVETGIKTFEIPKNGLNEGWGDPNNPNGSLVGADVGQHHVDLTIAGGTKSTGGFKVIS